MSKYIIKQFWLLIIIISISLFFLNCHNNFILREPDRDKPVINLPAGYGSASLMISNWIDDDSPRTVFPPYPVFSSYEFSFSPKNEQQQPEFSIISELPILNDIDLEEGEWEITAYGRVEFYGREERIAEGSETVTVINNESIEVFITIRSKPLESIEGSLDWKLNISDDIDADFWKLTLSDWFNDKIVLERNGMVSNGEIKGFSLCENGYYLLRISVGTERREVSYFSVVHIRAYETTFYERLVKQDELLPVINIIGTIDLSSTALDGINIGISPNIKDVRAYSSSGIIARFSDIAGNNWSMRIVEPPEEIEMEFSVLLIINEIEVELKYNEKIKVHKDDLSVNIKIEKNLLKLGGQLNLHTINNYDYSGWEINAFTDEIPSLAINNVNIGISGAWEMVIETFSEPTSVHFSVENIINGKKYRRVFPDKASVENTRILSRIMLDANFLPPTQVIIQGNIFSDGRNEIMKNYNGRFAFTRKMDIISQETYSFKIISYFGNESKVYSFQDVIIDNSGLTLYKDPDENESIKWNNNEASGIHPIDNVRITINFLNDEFLDERMIPLIKAEKTNDVYIPGGTFMMGSPVGEIGRNGPPPPVGSGMSSETPHSVVLSSFYMMSTEVSQQLFRDIMNNNPVKNSSEYVFRFDNYPVVNVSWFDAIEFANKLSDRNGLTRVYSISGTGGNRSISSIDWFASGWRLPTEAEWEYAARAGSSNPFGVFHDGNGNILNEDGIVINYNLANYNFERMTGNEYSIKLENKNYIECIKDINSHYPNNFGLYNMHGNVWELCWDIFEGDYGTQAQIDPIGHRDSGFYYVFGEKTDDEKKVVVNNQHRIIRGGSYYTPARYLRSAHRGIIMPNNDTYNDIGFRLVRKDMLP